MTDQQILELADDYLEEWEADEDGRIWKEYSGTCEDILAFAKKIYQMGYNEGYDEGWDSRAQSEYTHSGLFGEPQ